eukprot:6487471-Amphidinium_carterae.2
MHELMLAHTQCTGTRGVEATDTPKLCLETTIRFSAALSPQAMLRITVLIVNVGKQVGQWLTSGGDGSYMEVTVSEHIIG